MGGIWKRTGRWATAALLCVSLCAAWAVNARAAPRIGAYTTRGAWSFVSDPGLHPPKLPVVGRPASSQLAHGDFLLDNFPNQGIKGPLLGQGGPLITDSTLQPVWFSPTPTRLASSDLQQETYAGQPVLVWWQGTLTRTGQTLSGQVVVVDQHYRRIAAIRARAPWVISLHDAVINGTDLWVTAYRSVRNQNLAAYGGSRRGTVYDAGVLEYDLRTGKLLYTWDALNPGHVPNVPLSASEQPASAKVAPGAPWDAYHLNAVQVLQGNQILVSMRNTWAAYLIDTTTNRIVWTLGGKHSSFTFGPGARFGWQHHVELISTDEVTLFNDNCCRLLPGGRFARPNGPSAGMVLKLDPARRSASLVAAYRHRPNLGVAFLGSMQLLPGGNALVSWGALSYLSEYTRSGRQILDVVAPGKDQTYRALFTSSWVGRPYYPPRGAVRRAGGRPTTVYASWNGATQVASWQVLGGAGPQHLAQLAVGAKTGFETAIRVGAGAKVFQVRAYDAHGHLLGTSRVFD